MKISPRTARRMKAYFSRHSVDRRPGWGNPNNPTKGYIAWLLWGGDAGKKWSEKIVRQMNRIDGAE